jgi:2-polyprenyl-6-hydroxyphenyl methylase/3-demethylubiquinone-9 3-methyltransferase
VIFIAMMNRYYSDTLAARNLERCYKIAPDRIRQYLDAEIDFVRRIINPSDRIVELGCGYGRVLKEFLEITPNIVGLDTSFGSLLYGKPDVMEAKPVQLVQMDAGMTALQNDVFDVVICIQNGISAFKMDPKTLVEESLRIAVPGGKCLFSTYSDRIWEERLHWFELQAKEKLLGEIDRAKTRRGTIVCKDGFVASTFTETDFNNIACELSVSCETIEVDSSSLFAIFIVS